jgi:hypothetical protein
LEKGLQGKSIRNDLFFIFSYRLQVILAPPAELRAGDAVNVINQAHGM